MIRLCGAAVLAAALAACAFGRLAPGLTKEGVALPVSADSLEEARRQAVAEALEILASPGPAVRAGLFARAGEFAGRARLKGGSGVVEVRLAPLIAELDREGLLKPAGFSSREPRALLLVSEPDVFADFGVGPAGDALRRGLAARGVTATDGRDALNGFSAKGKSAAELAAAGARAGADWVLIAAAAVEAEADPGAGSWRARAEIVVDRYEGGAASPSGRERAESATLDVSSASARAKALEDAGMEAAARVAASIARARGGRSEAAVTVAGGADWRRLKAFLALLRGTEGVAGAHLGSWRGEESAVVFRVFLAGLKTDGLAARLLRREPGLTLLSVEADDGRLAVELGSAAP